MLQQCERTADEVRQRSKHRTVSYYLGIPLSRVAIFFTKVKPHLRAPPLTIHDCAVTLADSSLLVFGRLGIKTRKDSGTIDVRVPVPIDSLISGMIISGDTLAEKSRPENVEESQVKVP